MYLKVLFLTFLYSDNFLFIPFKPIFSLFFECIENKVPLLISLSINNNDFF